MTFVKPTDAEIEAERWQLLRVQLGREPTKLERDLYDSIWEVQQEVRHLQDAMFNFMKQNSG